MKPEFRKKNSNITNDPVMPSGRANKTDSYAHKLALSDHLRTPTIRSAIQALGLPLGSRGLDAGCGIGSHTLLLAEELGPRAHVTGLDTSPGFLTLADKRAQESGMSEQVSFRKGDVKSLPFDDNTFDWVWSADCVGYIPLEPLPLIKECARVVKPGGTVAVCAWSSQQLLPGYPLLEARLNATSQGIAPFTTGKRPDAHFLRALGWFQEAGLKNLKVRTFAGGVHAPLSDNIHEALISLFHMRWGDPDGELSQEECATYRRLIRPESPDLILNLSDYYAFFTYSLFQGSVPG